jgi:hypothetical protein
VPPLDDAVVDDEAPPADVGGSSAIAVDKEVVEVVEVASTGVLADGSSDVEKLVTLLGAAVTLMVVAEVAVVLEIIEAAVVVAADTADVTAATTNCG